jgi:hypothetical protein
VRWQWAFVLVAGLLALILLKDRVLDGTAQVVATILLLVGGFFVTLFLVRRRPLG